MKAFIQCADTSPLESLVQMLEESCPGVRCYIPATALATELSKLGGLVLTTQYLQQSMGYEAPTGVQETNTLAGMDVYFDVKAHQTHARLVRKYPHLAGKVVWYRINGGEPEHVVRQCPACAAKQPEAQAYKIRCPKCEDCGDEVNPPCPVVTPNLWYGTYEHQIMVDHPERIYTMWPPFVHDYVYQRRPLTLSSGQAVYTPPVCLIHNLSGWGYDQLIPMVRALGVKQYGRGSPDGLLHHSQIPPLLSTALAMVHLKSSDAPGYALYEAIASKCPLVLPRRLVWRCKMQQLFEPYETYLPFDHETHDALDDAQAARCRDEIRDALEFLKDPANNARIAENALRRFKALEWGAKMADVTSFAEFLRTQVKDWRG